MKRRGLFRVATRRNLSQLIVTEPSSVLDQKTSSILTNGSFGWSSAAGQRSSVFRSSSQASFQRSSPRPEKVKTSSSVDDTALSDALRNSLLRAPYQRVSGRGGRALFPWRSSHEILDRLVPGSEEFERRGYLLGGNVISSNPTFDAYATAYFFMNVPMHQMLFFQHWQDDTTENMSWAFSQGMSGILSSVYEQSFESLSKDRRLGFDSTTTGIDTGRLSSGLSTEHLEAMVEEKLRVLFQSAREYGKDQIQVRLDCKPRNAHMINLFVFPFLSRNLLKREAEIKDKYLQFLDLMGTNPREAMPIYNGFVSEFAERGYTENTVIAQVLITCDEVFWVKDLETGRVIQGVKDETPRTVCHLVRMEMVVRSTPSDGFLPFRHEQGNWQLTDIDDLLDGNLLL